MLTIETGRTWTYSELDSTGLQPAALPIMRTFSFTQTTSENALSRTWTHSPEASVLCSTSWAIEALSYIYGEIGTRTLTSVMQTQNTSLYIISPSLLVITLNGYHVTTVSVKMLVLQRHQIWHNKYWIHGELISLIWERSEVWRYTAGSSTRMSTTERILRVPISK